MAKVRQVVLMGCKTFTDKGFKFKQNVPVTMRSEVDFQRYASNSLFSTREIDEERLVGAGLSNSKINAGDPFGNTVSDDTVKLPNRKKLSPKGE